jgi:hypothetical protein
MSEALNMTKNKRNNSRTNFLSLQTLKIGVLALFITLTATTLLLCLFLSTETSSASPIIGTAQSKSQFKIDVVYGYVGQGNDSYTNYKNETMHLITQYPSAFILNITRLAGTQVSNCDAILEVYSLKITTNTGQNESYAYFVGTACNDAYNGANLSLTSKYINELVNTHDYLSVKGDVLLHWKENESILSHTIGSACSYTNCNYTALGLWSKGKPNAISVTTERLGYITLDKGVVSVFKDSETTKVPTVNSLNSYDYGFLYNTVLSADKLSRNNLFSAIPQDERIPTSALSQSFIP